MSSPFIGAYGPWACGNHTFGPFLHRTILFFNIELYECPPLPPFSLSTHTHTQILTLSSVTLANIFSHSVGCLFVLLTVSLTVQKCFLIFGYFLKYGMLHKFAYHLARGPC